MSGDQFPESSPSAKLAAFTAAADYIDDLLDDGELEAEIDTQLALEDDFIHLFLLGVKYGKEEASKESGAKAQANGCGCEGGSVCCKQS